MLWPELCLDDGERMEIVNFTKELQEPAEKLAWEAYERERVQVPALPQLGMPTLDPFVENGLGVAAVEGGKLVGFLAPVSPFDHAFGSTPVKGVFSPMGAHGAAGTMGAGGEEREKIYGAMYQVASKKWVLAGAASHAVCLYAHDEALQRLWYRYGFGLRCMDAIRSTEWTDALPSCPYEVRMVSNGDFSALRPLRRLLKTHLGESPCFMVTPQGELEAFLSQQEQEEENVIFACYHHNAPIAFLELTDGGETFVAEAPEVKNICGAFCLPAYRGQGVMQSLLYHAMAVLKEAGIPLLGVDFESINPPAYGFWLKYFTPYTHGVVRRVDEDALGHPVRISTVCKQ